MIALFSTVFNRWMLIALPSRYKDFMTRRLIFLYCLLCYLIALFNDDRWFAALSFSDALRATIFYIYEMLPWILTVIFSALLFYMLLQHHMTSTALNERRLKESRSVLIAVFAQILISIFSRIPYNVIMLCITFNILSPGEMFSGWFFTVINLILSITIYWQSTIMCVTILVTMGPYRRALLSLISPMIKRCMCLMKRICPKKNNVQTVNLSTNTTVGTVRPTPINKTQ